MSLKPSQYGQNSRNTAVYPSVVVPNLAPSLLDILNSSRLGQPIGRCGTPQFDDSIEAGIARSNAEALDPSELYASQINGDLKPEQKPSNHPTSSPIASEEGATEQQKELANDGAK